MILRNKFKIRKRNVEKSTITRVKNKEQSIENYLDDDDHMFYSNAGFEKRTRIHMISHKYNSKQLFTLESSYALVKKM